MSLGDLKIESLAIDADELREELLEILTAFDQPVELQTLHSRSEISPGRATTSGALTHLVRAGQVRRILSPVSHKALYALVEDAVPEAPAVKAEAKPRPAAVADPKPKAAPAPTPATPGEPAGPSLRAHIRIPDVAPFNPSHAPSLRGRIREVLAVSEQPLMSWEIAAALGDPKLSAKVGSALWDMVNVGQARKQPHGSSKNWLWSAPDGSINPDRLRLPHGPPIKSRVIAYLSVTDKALTTREVADELGGLPSKDVSVVLGRLAREGHVERTRIGGNNAHNRCRWRWIGGAVGEVTSDRVTGDRVTSDMQAGPLPTPRPSRVTPHASPSAVDWLLTGAGHLVLRNDGHELRLSARQALGLYQFLSALHIHHLIGLQEDHS